ncbi:MAG: mycothiol system anti-sigma-R factor [Gemmatimonadota bacterium]|nr:MAG: mycothiol system anti-sigma-R factor [Gemmatimonadota bacterium]
MNAPRKIDCQEAAERLYEYLDGELTPDSEAEVRAHLDDCAPCFKLLGFEDAYLSFLRARTRAHQAPEHLKKKIFEQVLFDQDSAS